MYVSFIYIVMSNPYLYCKDKSLSLGDFFRLAVQLPIAAREQEGDKDALIFDIPSTAPTSGVYQVTPSHTNEEALRRWLYVGGPRRTRWVYIDRNNVASHDVAGRAWVGHVLGL